MINYTELEVALRDMNERSKLFALVKAEMERRGRWKRAPRGKPIVRHDQFSHPE